MNSNDALLDAAIRHAHALARFKNGEVARILGLLNRQTYPAIVKLLQDRLADIDARGYDRGVASTKRLRDMLKSIEALLEEGAKLARVKLEKDLGGLATVEAAAAVKQLERAATISWEFSLPAPETLRALVTSRPFAGELLADHFDTFTRTSQDRIKRALNIGLTANETGPDIVRRVIGTKALRFKDGALEQSRRNVTSLVRTATNHVSTAAREQTYRDNGDIVKGVRWVSTLDSRTTPICQERDGEVYPVDSGPRPPAHWGCRSTTTPVLKSWKELGLKGSDITTKTRASMTGEVPADLTYPEWLKRQSSEIQDEALGPKRAAMFRSGEVAFDAFTDDFGRLLTLDELSSLAGA